MRAMSPRAENKRHPVITPKTSKCGSGRVNPIVAIHVNLPAKSMQPEMVHNKSPIGNVSAANTKMKIQMWLKRFP